MRDYGIVKPGSVISMTYSSYAGSSGASATQTGFATSDIQIYKNGSTTQRASTSGFTATTDFDSLTGLHMIVIDLADNTDAGFYSAGARYDVAVADVTIDSQAVRTWVGSFRIGQPAAILNTTIATLSSQTSFTLTSGPAEDDALTGCVVVIHDVASAVQMGHGYITGYTGSTKTVTLAAGTTFTAAATDNISIFPRVQIYGAAGTAWNSGAIEANTLASNAITAAKIATDAIGAAQLASDAVSEIQSGLATATNLATVDTVVDAIKLVTDALPDSGALTSLATATALATVDSNVDAIKAKTDNLPASPAAVSDIPTSAAIATAVADEFSVAADAVEASPTPSDTSFAGSSSLSSDDDFYNGSVLVFTSGDLDGIARKISDYVGSTNTFTVTPAFPSAPSSSDTFRILGRID